MGFLIGTEVVSSLTHLTNVPHLCTRTRYRLCFFPVNFEDGTLEIVDMNADGNCLFRALSDQLNGDHGGNHDQIRADICDYMEENKNDFSVFLVLEDDGDEGEDATDFESYVKTMRDDGVWGGHLELVAASRIYGYVYMSSNLIFRRSRFSVFAQHVLSVVAARSPCFRPHWQRLRLTMARKPQGDQV